MKPFDQFWVFLTKRNKGTFNTGDSLAWTFPWFAKYSANTISLSSMNIRSAKNSTNSSLVPIQLPVPALLPSQVPPSKSKFNKTVLRKIYSLCLTVQKHISARKKRERTENGTKEKGWMDQIRESKEERPKQFSWNNRSRIRKIISSYTNSAAMKTFVK